MKKLLFIFLLLASISAFSQTPAQYLTSLKVNNPYSLDWKQGPWADAATAITNVPIGIRVAGLTVFLLDCNCEYVWLDGDLTDTGLIPKTGAAPTLQTVIDAGSTAATTNDITLESDTRIKNYVSGTYEVSDELRSDGGGTYAQTKVTDGTSTAQSRILVGPYSTEIHSRTYLAEATDSANWYVQTGQIGGSVNSGLIEGRWQITPQFSAITVDNGAGRSLVLQMKDSAATFVSTYSSFKGLKYSTNISANLTALSIPPKIYVDSKLGGKNVDALIISPTVTENGKVVAWNNTNNEYELIAAGGGGAVALNSITAATATNTINNAANAQEWQWNSLAAGTGLLLSSSSTAAASNTNTLFKVEQTGANATGGQFTRSARFNNTKTGGGINIALTLNASGGATNYALDAAGGVYIEGTVTEEPFYAKASSGVNQGVFLAIGGGQFSPIQNSGTDLGNSSQAFKDAYFTGNVAIGVGTAAAKLHSRGSGTTTGFNFLTENSSGTDRFGVLDNGEVQFSGIPGTTGQLLRSSGTGAAPTWSSSISLPSLETTGDFKASFASTTSNITLDATHYTILVDASSAARTVTLPSALSANRRIYVIKKFDNVNNVTIDADGAETIDRSTTQTLSIQYASITIQSDGTEWWILSNKN